MDRVGAHPRARGVRSFTLELQEHPERALAAALDLTVRRLQEDREVALQPVGMGLGDVLEAVEVGGDLFVVVEDERRRSRLGAGTVAAMRSWTATPDFMSQVPQPHRTPFSSRREGTLSAIGTVSM